MKAVAWRVVSHSVRADYIRAEYHITNPFSVGLTKPTLNVNKADLFNFFNVFFPRL